MIEVISVQPCSDYSLLLSFSNGENKYFDMKPYLHYPVFQKLQNPGFFALASVDYGTVTWPGEIDIAPETLYAKSISSENVKTCGECSGKGKFQSTICGECSSRDCYNSYCPDPDAWIGKPTQIFKKCDSCNGNGYVIKKFTAEQHS